MNEVTRKGLAREARTRLECEDSMAHLIEDAENV
jgi:hypothetical protein